MLRLGLVRHAKSSWNYPDLSDHDRPLNKRGERDAPIMAAKVKELYGVPDLIQSSTANRALITAKTFAELMNLPADNLSTSKKMYHASEEDILDCISMVDDENKFALFFGHNPTMTYLANQFKGGDIIDNVPTCGVVMLESEASIWSEIDLSNTRKVAFIYPKMYV